MNGKHHKLQPDSPCYAERDPMALDKAGEYYTRHVCAMTREGLHEKSDIAAELAWRDYRLALAEKVVQAAKDIPLGMATDPYGRMYKALLAYDEVKPWT